MTGRYLVLLSSAALLLACGAGNPSAGDDAGHGLDAGVYDAGDQVDAGSSDAGNVLDGGASDAGNGVDAGIGDAGNQLDAGGAVADPNAAGPYATQIIDSSINVAASGDNNVAIHCVYPTSGPAAGPYPVVIVAHGLSLAASQYYSYLSRLASFGYVALTVDYPASAFSVNNAKEAQDLLAGIDWAGANATVGPLSNTQRVGMTGHSLGGKLALLAATMDARIKAAIVLDPVDGTTGTCTAPACAEVAPLMPGLHIPTGFLGETTDASGGVAGMPCAPAASNFTTFYARTNSPSLEVTVAGAGHMSFLDDEATCGLVCALCTAGTDSNSLVLGISTAYVTAFYERHLRGNIAYDSYLIGPVAQSRYVATGEVSILSR